MPYGHCYAHLSVKLFMDLRGSWVDVKHIQAFSVSRSIKKETCWDHVLPKSFRMSLSAEKLELNLQPLEKQYLKFYYLYYSHQR